VLPAPAAPHPSAGALSFNDLEIKRCYVDQAYLQMHTVLSPRRFPPRAAGAAFWHHQDIQQKDIYGIAQFMIVQHGDDAAVHAAMRADQLIEAGDVQGIYVWKRVLKAIEELTSSVLRGVVH
jgi:hypothetical protein